MNQLADLKDRVAASQAKVDQFQRDSGLTGMTMTSSSQPGQTGVMQSPSDNVPLERLLELNRDLTGAEVSRIATTSISPMTETQDLYEIDVPGVSDDRSEKRNIFCVEIPSLSIEGVEIGEPTGPDLTHLTRRYSAHNVAQVTCKKLQQRKY